MTTLDPLWQRGKNFLGVSYPIIAGAMTWISDSHFVSAVCNEGALGCLAAGNMEPSLLDAEIKKTMELTDKPFAVNLITIAPFYKKHLEVATKNRVPFIVFAGSYPRKPEIKLAKESGAKVLSFASTESLAKRLIDMGIDALILEGSEAGGHVGHVSLGILLQQGFAPSCQRGRHRIWLSHGGSKCWTHRSSPPAQRCISRFDQGSRRRTGKGQRKNKVIAFILLKTWLFYFP